METKIKGNRLKRMRNKKKWLGIMTTVLYVLVRNIKTAEMKMAYKTISKTDKIALKLTTEPSDPKINPEEYIQYSTKNPQVSEKSHNFDLISNLGKDMCQELTTHSVSATEENLYMICNSNEVRLFSKNPSNANEIYTLKSSSKLKKSEAFEETTCIKLKIFKDVASSNTKVKIVCRVKTKDTKSTFYKIVEVKIGSEIDLEDKEGIDLSMDKDFPLEPEMEIIEGMVKYKKQDGNTVNVQSLIFYRKTPLNVLNDQSEYNNGYARIVSLADKSVNLFNFNQNELKTKQIKFINSVYLLDHVTFVISGFVKSSNFLTSFRIVKNEADFTFKSLSESKLPEDVKKGFADIEVFKDSKGEEKMVVVYCDIEKKLHGICGVDFVNNKGYVGKCKYEQSLTNSISYKSYGCINEKQCFFGFKSQTDFSSITGYSKFTITDAENFPSNFQIFFKGKEIVMNSKFSLIGLSTENWLKEFNNKKLTVFEIDCSKLTKTPEELIIEKKTFNPSDKKVTTDTYKIEITTIPSLFEDFNIPSSLQKIFWYVDTFFTVDPNNSLYNGNALEFSTEGEGIESYVISDNELNFKYEDGKYTNVDLSSTKIIPFGSKVVRFKTKGKIEFFDCKFEEKNTIDYLCKFIKEYETIVNENLLEIFDLDSTTDIIVTNFGEAFKSKVFFIIEGMVIEKNLDYKILSFDAVKIQNSIHLIMATSSLDDKKKSISYLTRVRFEKTGTKGDDLSLNNVYQIPISSVGSDLNCLRKLKFYVSENKIILLNNCGDFKDSIIEVKIDDKGKIINTGLMRFYDESFGNSKKDSLQFCYKGEQLLIVELNTNKIKMTRKNLLEFEEDMGLKELGIEKIINVFCPESSEKFLILGQLKPEKDQKEEKFKAVIYQWNMFTNAENRIVSKSKEIKSLTQPIFSYKNERFNLNYLEETIKKEGKSEYKSKSISFNDMKTRILMKSKKKTLENIFLVVKNLAKTKKVQITGEFTSYDENLKFEVQDLPFLEEKTYKFADIVKSQGPILEINLKGDQFLRKNVIMNHRIQFNRDLEDFKFRRRRRELEENILKQKFNENHKKTRILQSGPEFEIFKVMKYKQDILSGLLDITQDSRILLYNNTRKLEKRLDYKTKCSTFDFDIIKSTEEMAIGAICQNPKNTKEDVFNVKLTNLDGFKVQVKEIQSKAPIDANEISTIFGKNTEDVIFITWKAENKKLEVYRTDVSKAVLNKDTQIYDNDFTKILDVTNGKVFINIFFFSYFLQLLKIPK